MCSSDLVWPSRLATSARVVERAPLVLNSFAAQDSTAARLVSRCRPRLKGERFVGVEVSKISLSNADPDGPFSKFDNLNFKYFY